MNIIEAMEERTSVRTYTDQPLSDAQSNELRQAIAKAYNPFGGHATIRLANFNLDGPFRPSTYGVISGASSYLLMGIAADRMSALSAGFMMEQVVLKATEMGLGTCWIAASFKGTDFADKADMPDDEPLKIVSPVGYPASKKKFLEKITRFAARSNTRKPFETLFFSKNFETPLATDNKFAPSLEMLRIAPSSTNSQPWRAVVDGDTVHFFYLDKSKASILDCGIGICHFYLAEQFHGFDGNFHSAACQAPERYHYLISWTRK